MTTGAGPVTREGRGRLVQALQSSLAMALRLLVVDGSRLMAWLVAQVVPPGVEVVHVASLADAERILVEDPPAAAIFNVTPTLAAWRALVDRCAGHRPPIPYLCSSALDGAETLASGLAPGDPAFLPKSLPVAELRARVGALLARARAESAKRRPAPPAP